MNVTRETQELIISALVKSSYLFSICKNEITEGYFSDPSCKVIYKSLSSYYTRYNSTPRLNELLIKVEDCYYPTVGVNLSEVKDTCCRIYEIEEPDENFIKDKITDFIRKVRSTSALKNFVDQIKANPNMEEQSIVTELARALEVQLSTTKVFMMNDADQIKEARNSAVGSSDQSSIVKSFIGSLNKCLMFGGWQPSTVNMVVAPPGCFVGDTRILTIDGSSHTLEELYNARTAPGIYGCDENGTLRAGTSQEVYLSDYVNELVDVEIDGKYTIRCTPDHPFMTRNGQYKSAETLSEFDELMPIRRVMRPLFKVGKSLYETIENGDGDYWFTHKLSDNLVDHHPVIQKNGQNSEMTRKLNFEKDFQDKTQRGKILSFINRLLVEFPETTLTKDSYDAVAEKSSAKHKIWMKDIRKYFNCPWSEIISTAESYNRRVTKVTKVHLEEKVPVYGIVDAKPFNNFAIALSDEDGVFVT